MPTDKLTTGDSGSKVADLHVQLQNSGAAVSSEEVKRTLFGPSTAEAVNAVQKQNGLPGTGVVDQATSAILNLGSSVKAPSGGFATPNPNTPATPSSPPPSTSGNTSNAGDGTTGVGGFVYMDYGIPADSLKLRLYSKGFGGNDTLVSNTNSDASGNYKLPYDPTKIDSSNLEVRALDANGKEFVLSSPFVGADTATGDAALNLIAPTDVKPIAGSEFMRLGADVTTAIGSFAKIADAKEQGESQDLSFLSNATNWDARILALAAHAAAVSQSANISHEALYAMMRAGLPTDPDELAHVSTDDVQRALDAATVNGIVNLDNTQKSTAVTAFKSFAANTKLQTKEVSAVSPYSEFLNVHNLAADKLSAFATTYFSPRKTGAELWQNLKTAGIPDDTIKSMQLQGKIGFLTGNNAPLTKDLQSSIGANDDISALVGKGFYEPSAFDARLKALAGTLDDNADAINKLIPPAYIGGTTAERKQAYIQDMADKVRTAYPEKVLRSRVDAGVIPFSSNTVKSGVSDFLAKAESLNFTIGDTHLDSFVSTNKQTVFQATTVEQQASTVDGLKLVQRIYQVSPNDESMQILFDMGFSSASDVVRISRGNFMDTFQKKYLLKFPATAVYKILELGNLIYNKSFQITTTTYTFNSVVQQLQQTPPVFAISGGADKQQADQAQLNEKINGFPTLQQLFGSLDYCEREACRSVLSPAAYLVNLLQFLDTKDAEWQYVLDNWKKTHGGEDYTTKYSKPYDALIDRRPDIINLPLTCENTNTALPYIDIVNEILEYYLVNKKLTASAARDTGTAASAELLAEPQNIEPKAYGILKQSLYPLSLPFDLWIETVRRFCGQYDIGFSDLISSLQPVAGGDLDMQRRICLESLNISPAEYNLYAIKDVLTGLSGIFGYPDDPSMLADLKSAKQLSSRLGVSYKELVQLFSTRFVNPQIDELILIHKMEISAYDVIRYKKAPGFAPFSDIDQQAFTDRLSQFSTLYGIDAAAEIDKAWNAKVFSQALLLNDTTDNCNFDHTTVGYFDRGALKFDFLKLNLFVRLWRKLGWEISELDRAMDVFLPSNLKTIIHDPSKAETDRAKSLATGLSTALVYFAHLKSLSTQVNIGNQSTIKLSCLWSDIPTTGSDSLYAQLFLTRNVLKIDQVFDDALGRYLTGNLLIHSNNDDHTVALQAALNLTAQDIAIIFQDNKMDLNSVVLSMSNISLLFRYGLLSKGLKLSINDLIILKQLSGLNPFMPLVPDELKTIADDKFMNQLLAFVQVAKKVKKSGFTLEDLNYLCNHNFDPKGTYRNVDTTAASIVNSLKDAISSINDKYNTPVNSSDLSQFAGYTDDVLQAQLALVLLPADLRTFMSTWSGNQGKNWESVKNSLSLFLTVDQYNSLFVPLPADADNVTVQNNILAKRATLVLALYPYLKHQLILQAVTGILSQGTGAGTDRINWLIGDAARLHDDSNLALINTFEQAADDSKSVSVKAAVILLGKVLQIADKFALSDNELEYFISNPNDFDNLNFSIIPASLNAVLGFGGQIFKYLLRIADYVSLRQDLTGGGDDIIALFQNSRLSYAASLGMSTVRATHLSLLYKMLADLTRRDPATISATAGRLGIDISTQVNNSNILVTASSFADERGITLLWNALKLIQVFGVPVDVLADTVKITDISQTDEQCKTIAQNLKNAIKSRYESDDWQQIAQPIYDQLRGVQRDALVTYHLYTFGNLFSTVEEMYEYFLIDPGTEPVVQTSRIRIYTASVQLFIQRCLLNLENRWDKKVPPGVINAGLWTWMNRYRLWEANMKIFLWPENWLEPEWRDDKTNMFQELEGKLLQGDVSDDLVEDAFFVYLQKLEAIARLDIVSLYDEEDAVTPGSNKLHIVGRSFGQPHAYYYRTYAQEMWTPWEPVDAEIDGDHIVGMIWRNRFHIFWVTFLQRVPPDTKPVANTPDSQSTLGNWNVGDALSVVAGGANVKILEAHLHYSEYYQGKWSSKKSAGTEFPIIFQVPPSASSSDISIYATKEASNPIDSTLDGAVLINLKSATDSQSFRVINKNTPPSIVQNTSPELKWPYINNTIAINRLEYKNGGSLQVQVDQQVTTLNGKLVPVTPSPTTILGSSQGQFSLLPCGDVSTIGSDEGFGPIVTPFFYQDDWHTFYVESSITQTVTITDWDEWVGVPNIIYYPTVRLPNPILLDPVITWPKKIARPDFSAIPDPGDIRVKIPPRARQDAITAPGTLVKYGERLIGQSTGLNVIAVSPQTNQKVLVTDSNQLNNVLAGTSSIGKIQLVAAAGADKSLVAEPLIRINTGVEPVNTTAAVIVGSAGINAGVAAKAAVHFNGVFNNAAL
jgi:peptidoglycan hydrolase-like protein with peptidoglycan-binding domain